MVIEIDFYSICFVVHRALTMYIFVQSERIVKTQTKGVFGHNH